MKVLITGGAGYIGSHLVQTLLDAGHKPVVLDQAPMPAWWPWTPEEVPYVGCDIVEADWDYEFNYKEAFDGVEACVHLAAVSDVEAAQESSANCFRVNAVGTLELAEEWVKIFPGRPFVFASTASVYSGVDKPLFAGEKDLKGGFREHASCSPTHNYGLSKYAAEVGLAAIADKGLNLASLRFFNVAGAWPEKGLGERHEPETHLIPKVIAAALAGKAVTVYGTDWPTVDGTAVRDYVHVRDVCSAILASLTHLENKRDGATSVKYQPLTFNVGAERASVNDIFRIVSEAVLGAPGPASPPHPIGRDEQPRRSGDSAVLVANTELITKVLRWKPEWGLRDMVKDALAFVKASEPKSPTPERKTISDPILVERERCARHVESLANMVEEGAGPLNMPAARLRQAARSIRSGDLERLWTPDMQTNPEHKIPTPGCGHSAQSWAIACGECGAFPETTLRQGALSAIEILTQDRDTWKQIATRTAMKEGEPIPMLLWCPECKARHIDEGEFATKVHHTHSCQTCGLTWRPSVVATVGVRFLPGFKTVVIDTETSQPSGTTPFKPEPIRVATSRRVLSARRVGVDLTELTVDGSRRAIPFDLFDGEVVSDAEGLELGIE